MSALTNYKFFYKPSKIAVIMEIMAYSAWFSADKGRGNG
jgi:hypothetical protein